MTAVPTPGSSGRIVVSHARPDEELATSIAASLEARGVPCWLRARDGAAGSWGVETHAAAVDAATAILALVSEAATESAELRRDLDAAFSARRPIVALALRGALPAGQLRYYVGESRHFELGEDNESVLDELALALRRFLRVEELPRSAGALIGRRRELSEVVDLLRDVDVRLLTLTGPGGTGKTRLALESARSLVPDFEDGGVWVSLAPLRDPALVLPTTAQALAVEEQPGTELLDTLSDVLAGRELLLVLDNAEHLLPQLATTVAALSLRCPALRFLVTTRERLNIQGERVYAVPSLHADEAVELFLARAHTLGVRLEASNALTELCERLDRLPLALELAAARSSLFTPLQLLERLGQRLDLLQGARDVDPRQQTLRATIDWSYDLLAENERGAFRSLGVFAGGCTYDAAEAVADATADLVQSLIDKSLLRTRDTPQGRRYWMLETIREYATGQLDARADERDALLERHCSHYALLLELVGAKFESADEGTIAAVADEVLDIRAALEWAAGHGDPVRLARMVWHLGTLWNRLGLGVEAGAWAERALTAIDDAPREERAACLSLLGIAAWRRGEHERAAEAYLESADIWRLLGNKAQLAALLGNLGWVAVERDDDEQAARHFEEAAAVAREAGNEREELAALGYLSTLHIRSGDSDQATEVLREIATKAARIRADDRQAWALSNLGMAHALRGEYDEAGVALAEALDLLNRLGWTEGIVYTLAALAGVAAATGDPVRAARLLGAAEQLGESVDLRWQNDEARQKDATMERVRSALGAGYDEAVAAAALVSVESVITEEAVRSGESAKARAS